MNYIFHFSFIIILFTNLIFAQSDKTRIFNKIINNNLPPFTFVVTEISSDSSGIYSNKVFRIDIYKSKTKELLQSLNHEIIMGNDFFLNIEFLGNGYNRDVDSNLIDLDSDGYKDLMLLNGIGDMGRNYNYTPYFYNKKKNEFIINDELPDIINPDVNLKDKTFSEHISEGCYSNCFTENIYIMKNDIPIILEQIVQHPNDGDINYLITDTYHFNNGKRIKIKSEKFQFIK